MEKRSYGFGVSAVHDAEHRSVVRLRGETQRLLEQLQPQVSTRFVDCFVGDGLCLFFFFW